jgi:hypothetical protein
MNYFIQREEERYGPYTLADLQRYAASGDVALNDLAISDASSVPVPVSQIIGTIAVPPPVFVAAPPVTLADPFPRPPNLPWWLILLFVVFTCGYFLTIWEFVLSIWLKRAERQSKSLYFYICAIVFGLIYVSNSVVNWAMGTQSAVAGIFALVWLAFVLIGRFTFQGEMEKHYNETDPMAVELSGVMTFFFGGLYFQYQINDIYKRKQADRLYEMSR